MSQLNIDRPQGMPMYVAEQFETGRATGLGEDRLLALHLANEFDMANDVSAGLGLHVVTAYMWQRGQEFDLSRQRQYTHLSKALATTYEARQATAIAQAIGSTIAMETVIHELVDGYTRTVAVTTPGARDKMKLLSPARDADSMEVDAERPYLIYKSFALNAGFANFHRAVQGLGDDPEVNQPIIMPA